MPAATAFNRERSSEHAILRSYEICSCDAQPKIPAAPIGNRCTGSSVCRLLASRDVTRRFPRGDCGSGVLGRDSIAVVALRVVHGRNHDPRGLRGTNPKWKNMASLDYTHN